MSILLTTLFVYALGLLLTAVGSRLAGRCTTWCCALLGLPMWSWAARLRRSAWRCRS